MPSSVHILSELARDHLGFDLTGDGDEGGGAAIAALVAAESRHFWHLTRNQIILHHMRRLSVTPGARLIELGCGSGCVAGALARAGFRVTGVDGHRPLLEAAARREEPLTLWLHDLSRGVAALPEREYDVACLFDVIEHLEDPLAVLIEALECARPGGLLVGTVPALMGLWSGIDERAGHKLRYSTRTLRPLLASVPGARLLEIVPFNRVLVPLLWAQRLLVGRSSDTAHAIRNLAVPPAPVNATLGALVRLEQRLAPLLDRTNLEGASLWFALRKDVDQGLERLTSTSATTAETAKTPMPSRRPGGS